MGLKKAKRKKLRKLYDGFVRSYDRLVDPDPDLLILAIVKHVHECRDRNRALTTSGMALALGLGRDTFLNFSDADCEGLDDADEIVAVIATAKAYVEIDLEHRLTASATTTGAMFSLKSNFGWRDVTKLSVGGGKDGDDPIVPPPTTLDVSNLSTALLKELRAAVTNDSGA